MAANPVVSRHIAIDLGASSGRLMDIRIASGRITIAEAARFRTPMAPDPATGYECWDTDQILRHIHEGLDRAAAQGPIASLGVDTWGVDFVLLDAQRQQVGKAVCYRDHRTDDWEKFFVRMPREEVYRRTGIQFMCFNTLYQLASTVAREPAWIERARHLLLMPDYLHFRLSGVLSNEYTDSTTSQLLSLSGDWDAELLAAAGLNKSLMQPPIPAGTVLGPIELASGTAQVVAPATHDTASAVAATPLEGLDEAYISSGTWSLMGIESFTPIATAQALAMNFTNEGGIERRFRILKNLMGLWLVQRVAAEHNISDFAALAKEAATCQPFTSIVNPDDPLFLNPPSMTEALCAYCRRFRQPEPQTAAELARCVFDSLALAYRNVKEQLEQLSGRPLSRIRIVGGGCQNHFLNQLCADACQLPVVAGPVEASALGNALAQSIALGELENVDAARALVRRSFPMTEFAPGPPVPAAVCGVFQQMLATRFQ
jgi:rhamnulokinase